MSRWWAALVLAIAGGVAWTMRSYAFEDTWIWLTSLRVMALNLTGLAAFRALRNGPAAVALVGVAYFMALVSVTFAGVERRSDLTVVTLFFNASVIAGSALLAWWLERRAHRE